MFYDDRGPVGSVFSSVAVTLAVEKLTRTEAVSRTNFCLTVSIFISLVSGSVYALDNAFLREAQHEALSGK